MTNDFLHKSHQAAVAFPAGIPTASGAAGLFVSRPGSLPVMLLFRDWDLLWIRRGRTRFAVSGAAPFVAGVDDFVVLPPCTSIEVSSERAPQAWHFCHFVFRAAPRFHPSDARAADYAGPGAGVHLPLRFSADHAPRVKRAYARLARWDAINSQPWGFERALLELVGAVADFARLRRNRSKALLLRPPALDERVESIRRRVDAEPARAWKVGELAHQAGVTPGHLHALCRRSLGMSLKHYIVEARLRQALRLLKEPLDGKPPAIWQVAEACGFSSQHFFARQFRQHFRLTPLQYRNGAAVES